MEHVSRSFRKSILSAAVVSISCIVLTSASTAPAAEKPKAAGKCPDVTKVSVTSTNGAYPQGLKWDRIATSVASVDKSIGNTAVHIYLANFQITGNPVQARPGDGQGILYLMARSADPKQKEVKLKPGKFNFADFSGKAPQRGQADIKVKGGSSVQLNTQNTGEFEITAATDKEICGKFDLKDKWTSMSGEFRALIK